MYVVCSVVRFVYVLIVLCIVLCVLTVVYSVFCVVCCLYCGSVIGHIEPQTGQPESFLIHYLATLCHRNHTTGMHIPIPFGKHNIYAGLLYLVELCTSPTRNKTKKDYE